MSEEWERLRDREISEADREVERRTRLIEEGVVRAAVERLVRAGYFVDVVRDYAEGQVKLEKSRDADSIMCYLFSRDLELLHVYAPQSRSYGGDPSKPGHFAGWVELVHGAEAGVLSRYSPELRAIIEE